MTTKRKLYEKPSLEVFELKQQSQLLAGSAEVQDYNWNEEVTE